MYTPHAQYNAHPHLLYRPGDYSAGPYDAQHSFPQYQPTAPSYQQYHPVDPYAPSSSSQPNTSSLAHALDEHATISQVGPHLHGFPECEVFPRAPVSPQGSQSREEYPCDAAAENCYDETLYAGDVYGDVMSDDEDQPFTAFGFGYQMHAPSPPESLASEATYTPTYDNQAEIGYLNGHVVPLGIVREDDPLNDQLAANALPVLEPYESGPPRSLPPLDIPTQHPAFQFTRSYTLAEAITPIEEQPRPGRPSINSPVARPIPTTSAFAHADAYASALAHSTKTDPGYHDGRPTNATFPLATASLSTSPLPPHADPTLRARSPLRSAAPGPTGAIHSPKITTSPSSKTRNEQSGRPGESVIKLDVDVPREPKKKPLMACLFCRERKIACGHPSPEDQDRRCNQCRRRDLECVFPKECRRGQHKRTPRLARVSAIMNGEPLPPDDILLVGSFSQTSPSSPGVPSKPKSKSTSSAKARKAPNVGKADKSQDERRAVARTPAQRLTQQQLV